MTVVNELTFTSVIVAVNSVTLGAGAGIGGAVSSALARADIAKSMP
jgi:hypothetical protein